MNDIIVSAKMVADLRERTGAGLIDCKRALQESNGDPEGAITVLKKKGIASAAKRADRKASAGIIESYTHTDGRIGVLLELNCETDFVAKNAEFKALARDICMHIAAIAPLHIRREDIPADVVEKERQIYATQVEGKPANAVEAILKGKMDKFFASVCLLEQPFVKDQDVTVGELISGFGSRTGENIRVNRFVRFQVNL
jgi:elongation factor Ts